jgi:hypothetical protein
MNDIMDVNGCYAETKMFNYHLVNIGDRPCTIQVKVLHHLACIELTVEVIDINRDGKPYTKYNQDLTGERLTLKYI